jgi:transposase
VLGLKGRCLAALPLPPKKTSAEPTATQAAFRETKLEPLLADARPGKGQVFFVDVAPFVRGAFLCGVWCRIRLFLRGGSGRKRYRVLGAWKAVTKELVSSTTDATVTAETRCALLRKIAALGLQGPITWVLDNVRDQHGALVRALATSLNIHREFLPSYSPNLNLIERLWKFIKKQVLYGRHDATFQEFQAAIDGCLAKIPTKHREKLKSLMTHNFQTFDIASFLAA